MVDSHGMLFVVSAPSGAGKTSLVSQLIDMVSHVVVSTSFTTRAMRPGEKPGQDYYFVDDGAFKQLIEKQELIEYAQVHGKYYGTSRHWVEEQLQQGVDVILEIDFQGASQVRKHFDRVVSVFIVPPSREELQHRLHKRQQDDPAAMSRRIAHAAHEMQQASQYDYLVINTHFQDALTELAAIVHAERVKSGRQTRKLEEILATFD